MKISALTSQAFRVCESSNYRFSVLALGTMKRKKSGDGSERPDIDREKWKIVKWRHSTVKSYPLSIYWSSTRGSRALWVLERCHITEHGAESSNIPSYSMSCHRQHWTLLSHTFVCLNISSSHFLFFYLSHIHPPWHNIPLFNRPHMRYHKICHSTNACINRRFEDLNCTIINFEPAWRWVDVSTICNIT